METIREAASLGVHAPVVVALQLVGLDQVADLVRRLDRSLRQVRAGVERDARPVVEIVDHQAERLLDPVARDVGEPVEALHRRAVRQVEVPDRVERPTVTRRREIPRRGRQQARPDPVAHRPVVEPGPIGERDDAPGVDAERLPLRRGERAALDLGGQPGAEPGQRRERGEGLQVVDVAAQLVDDLLDELVAEVDAGEARLTRGDRVEDRGVDVVDRGVTLEEIGELRGEAVGDRGLDEDDRFVGQRGMEEAVAASVTGEATLEVVPAVDLVDGLGRDQALEHRRRRVPGDLAQLEQPDVEQRREVAGELVVEQAERGVPAAQRQEVGAQLDEEPHAQRQAGDHVEHGGVTRDDRTAQFALGLEASTPGRRGAQLLGRAVQGLRIGAELCRQQLEEPAPAVGVEPAVDLEQGFGRGPLGVRLALREQILDDLQDPLCIGRRQVGRHHQTALTAERAQDAVERASLGRLHHGHRSSLPAPAGSGVRSRARGPVHPNCGGLLMRARCVPPLETTTHFYEGAKLRWRTRNTRS